MDGDMYRAVTDYLGGSECFQTRAKACGIYLVNDG